MTVPNWQPGVYYPIGAKANWHGRVYEVVQPHTSQSDWEPQNVPALWRVGYNDSQQQQPQQHEQNFAPAAPVNAPLPPSCPPTMNQENQENHHKHNHHHAAKIATAVLGGAAALGIGIFASKKMGDKHTHKQFEDAAFARTQQLNELCRRGQAPPIAWVFVKTPHHIPQNALQTGNESDGTPLFSIRCQIKGGALHVGKASRDMKQAVVPYGGKEVFVESFEVLVLLSSTAPGIAPQQPFRWITVPSGAFNTGAGAPIEAGYEEDGKPIYVASTHVNGNSVQPGKYILNSNQANIPFGGKELLVNQYNILCWA